MKLFEICKKIEFNCFSKPGTFVECVCPTGLGGKLEKGKIYEVFGPGAGPPFPLLNIKYDEKNLEEFFISRFKIVNKENE